MTQGGKTLLIETGIQKHVCTFWKISYFIIWVKDPSSFICKGKTIHNGLTGGFYKGVNCEGCCIKLLYLNKNFTCDRNFSPFGRGINGDTER